MAKLCLIIFILIILTTSLLSTKVHSASTFTFVNKCDITVWPGILSNAGISPLPTTGFALQAGESRAINAPSSWGGRFWGRTHCTQDSTGKFSCLTGDCGSGTIECTGGAAPPATLAEFTLNGDSGRDFYDVSLVDGYNLPMLVAPQGGTGDNCTNTGCVRDLNDECPSELRVMDNGGAGVACKSACEAFRTDEYCCSGAYATPDTCSASKYSLVFKSACPTAYSYAYDDRTSTFTCVGADYIITFCPSPNTSQKAASDGQNTKPSTGGQNPGPGSGSSNSPRDSNMLYEGALDVNAATPSTCSHVLGLYMATVATIWLLCRHF